MASTMNDVAKLAGVSRQTISRALNEPGLLNADTLVKVRKAIELLNYHPNMTARNLANKTVRNIGLFMPFTAAQLRRNLFFTVISNVVCQTCAENDFVLQLFAAMPDEGYSTLFKKLYYEKRVGGLILTCPSVNTKEIVELIAGKIPFVLIGRPPLELDEVSFIDVDNVQAAYVATEHLFQLGHQQITLLNAPQMMTLSEDLRKGMHIAYKEFGIDPSLIQEIHTDLTLKSGFKEAYHLLEQHSTRPTAIITADDLVALGVKRAADQLNLDIPQNLSLVSVTQTGWGEMMDIQLTYVNTEFENLGIMAAKHLMDIINNNISAPLRSVLPVKLVEGQSSGENYIAKRGVLK